MIIGTGVTWEKLVRGNLTLSVKVSLAEIASLSGWALERVLDQLSLDRSYALARYSQ